MNQMYTAVKPTRFSINGARAFYKGEDYKFWVEYDLIADTVIVEFNDSEPDEDFDFEAWSDKAEAYIRQVVGQQVAA